MDFNNTEDFNINIISSWSGWGKESASKATTRIICEGETCNFANLFIDFYRSSRLGECLI